MSTQDIFGLQFVLSIVAFSVVIRALVSPWLGKLSKREALMWLTAPHVFRHVGMSFLVPGVVNEGLPESFAIPAAYGDLLTGLLALVAFIALQKNWRAQIGLVWLYSIVGIVDLAKALPQVDVAPYFNAAWFIPTMLVPLLLVTHAMSIARLVRREAEAPAPAEAKLAVGAQS